MMKTKWFVPIAALFLVGSFSHLQSSVAADVSSLPLTQDQLAIYEDFLTHYDQFGQLSNLLGMQPVTVPFNIDEPANSLTFEVTQRAIHGPGGCLHNLKLEPRSMTVHRFPPEIMQFGASDSVMRRLQAAGKFRPESPRQGFGPDGWSLTEFTLSEITFDVTHRYAVLTFSANCHCRGGQGGSVLYEHRNGKWQKVMDCADYWEG